MSAHKNTHNYGVDLLRIVSMLMVLTLHVLGQGGLLGAVGGEIYSLKYETVWALETAVFCAVNCYGLISGYVSCQTSMKPERLVQILLQALFWSLGITVAFAIFKPGSVDAAMWWKSIFPLTNKMYWYVTAYVVVFFLSPFLNYLIQNLERKKMNHLLGAMFILFSVYPTLVNKDIFLTLKGYSALWLCVLYICGGYIRKYECFKITKSYKLMLGFFACIAATCLGHFGIQMITTKIYGEPRFDMWLVSYTSPLILFAGIFLFVFFAHKKIQNKLAVKLIRIFAPLSFGVYLIHLQTMVWENLLLGISKGFLSYPYLGMLGCVILAVIAIFLLCILLEGCRAWLFSLLGVSVFSRFVADKGEQVIRWVAKKCKMDF